MNLYAKFWNLREAYRRIFRDGKPKQKDIKTFLDDMRSFCCVDSSCMVVAKDGRIDTHASAINEGRREVWLKIYQTLNLTDEQLNQLHNLKGEEDDN